jgi:hypothetical protein
MSWYSAAKARGMCKRTNNIPEKHECNNMMRKIT